MAEKREIVSELGLTRIVTGQPTVAHLHLYTEKDSTVITSKAVVFWHTPSGGRQHILTGNSRDFSKVVTSVVARGTQKNIDAQHALLFTPAAIETIRREAYANYPSMADTADSLYKALCCAGIPIDNHESDIYFEITARSREILARFPDWAKGVKRFTSNIDGKPNYEVSFAYGPFWNAKQEIARRFDDTTRLVCGKQEVPANTLSQTNPASVAELTTVQQVLTKTDWSLLRDQKELVITLLQAATERVDEVQTLHLEGLLSWMDAIMDAANDEGYPVMFLTCDDQEVPANG